MRSALLLVTLMLAGCAVQMLPPPVASVPPTIESGAFTMADGASLPYRVWLPEKDPERPRAVVLALHGFNDSRDAWELPGPVMAEAGIAVFAPDQRGFGAAPERGLWAGGDAMAADARTMADELRQRFPGAPLYLMGESMGAAVLMVLATSADPPPVAGYVLIAPAVWGRVRMNLFLRSGLWLASTLAPGLAVGSGPVRVMASDNYDALMRLTTDPLTIRQTRFDTLRGLVDLMDAALAAAPRVPANALLLYGGKDELVPAAATRATWEALPAGPRVAFYPKGYHLLLRDRERSLPTGDIVSWILDSAAPLPSGAEARAMAWRDAAG